MKFVTLQEHAELEDEFERLARATWPEFMMHDATGGKWWGQLYQRFREFQFLMLDGREVLGCGHTIPLSWDRGHELPDGGWTSVLEAGCTSTQAPDALSALAAIVDPAHLGTGLSRLIIGGMRELARTHGFADLVAPVRPNRKSDYPLIPMKTYISWTRKDGSPFDPWIRVHWRLGAEIVKVCPYSFEVRGSTEEWESWTQMSFESDGSYVVPGGLVPVEVQAGEGIYVEPNVWTRHRIDPSAPS